MATLWLIPGLYDSGPEHWQRHWQRSHGARVIEQRDWQTPLRDEWVATVERALDGSDDPIALAGHSTGCATIAFWAAATRHAARVRLAMLVGPSDTEAPSYPAGPVGFAPMPLARLPFPSIVVASDDDPYVTIPRARAFATAWGSELHVLSRGGHINAASGHGPWPDGYALVERGLL